MPTSTLVPSMLAKGRLTPDNAAPAADTSNFLSSPVKSSKNVAGHSREEVATKVLPNVMGSYIRPDLFFKLCNKSGTLVGFTKKFVREMEVVEYLNELSEAVRKEDCRSDSIRFLLSENTNPEEHPTGTKRRPDFVAIKIAPEVEYPPLVTLEQKVVSRSQSANKHELGWSQLEATGEILSKGKSLKTAIDQGASYTVYLLQARPDLVSVVGIFIHPEKFEFQLYFTDAWGVCCTQAIGFDFEYAIPLLVAWIRHLHDPEPRLSITRVGSFPDKPTFTVVTSDMKNFTGCVLLSIGSPFHRRSTVFTTTDTLVIKSQYVEIGHRFEEGPILSRIHESRDFPGVVRLLPATQMSNMGLEADVAEQESITEEDVSSEQEEEAASEQERETAASVDADWPHSRRHKQTKETLLVFQDKAGPLMDAETPLAALIAFYDLLEVTRFLYKLCKIFHRDISSGNVLLRQKNWEPEKRFEGDFGDMCFASHLLGEIGPNPTASRLYTRMVLIDFHMAEDRGIASGKQATDRSGTPMFMARLVRKSAVKKGGYPIQPILQLQDLALERYKACVSDRLGEFPANYRDFYWIENDKDIQYSHRLSYDAEAILWLLLWWAVQAKPRKGDNQNFIQEDLWVDLTGGEGGYDPRQRLVSAGLEEVCHPVYRGLDGLLQSLFEQLLGYQEQIARPPEEQDPGRMKDEYLHEALQRTILDFLVKNIDEPFMREPISLTRRPKQGGGMAQSIRTPGVSSRAKRDLAAMAGEEKELIDGPFQRTRQKTG